MGFFLLTFSSEVHAEHIIELVHKDEHHLQAVVITLRSGVVSMAAM